MRNGNSGIVSDFAMRRPSGSPPPTNGGGPMGRATMPMGPPNLIPLMQKMLGQQPNQGPQDFMRASGQKPVGGSGFNPYAAGRKQYGASPNRGPMRDKSPFQERDRNAMNLRNAMLKRLQARSQGRFMTPENLRDS